MKSKSAEKYLRRIYGGLCFMQEYNKQRIINPYTCKTAIQKAENDARDRAIKSYCVICVLEGSSECSCFLDIHCIYLRDFLKAYDNE